jgi:hypothetical protein
MRLTDGQIYDVARQAGFPDSVAQQMVAIALRESAGNPQAHNSTPPDDSYGLWQINMYGGLGAARLSQFGLTDPAQLYDPLTNARAAFSLYAGNPSNLAIAWAINKTGPPYYYAEKYQSFLSRAAAAAAGSSYNSDVVLASGGGGSTAIGSPPSFPKGHPTPAPADRPGKSAPPVSGTGGTHSPPTSKPSSPLPPAPSSTKS